MEKTHIFTALLCSVARMCSRSCAPSPSSHLLPPPRTHARCATEMNECHANNKKKETDTQPPSLCAICSAWSAYDGPKCFKCSATGIRRNARTHTHRSTAPRDSHFPNELRTRACVYVCLCQRRRLCRLRLRRRLRRTATIIIGRCDQIYLIFITFAPNDVLRMCAPAHIGNDLRSV